MSKDKILKIDVEQVFKTRAPKKKIPKFIINYLKKIVHQDEFNYFFETNPTLKNVDFIQGALDFLDITTTIYGKENLPPKDGRYIFASNHPLGGLDGMILGLLVGKEYDGKIKFFSNDLMMFLHPMKDMFIPVNKFGSQTKKHAEMMDELYSSDNNLVTFPAGMCSRKSKGEICDLEWKKNFISKAIQYERDVVPIYFEGKNSKFFYNLANLRKFLRIKFNIEMMYLPNEMFKQRGKHFTIKIGKAIPWQTFDRSKTHAEWAEWMKEKVYAMQ